MTDLLPGELMILKVHRHWVVLVRPLLLPLAVLVAVGAADWLLRDRVAVGTLMIVTLAGLAVGGAILIGAWIAWSSHSFTMTDQRVILESGIFNRSTKVIGLDRIQDISTRQSILGRLLGYGLVEIDAAGLSGAEVLDHLPRPNGFRDHVFSEASALRRQASTPDGQAVDPGR